jgi:hypothetical protein
MRINSTNLQYVGDIIRIKTSDDMAVSIRHQPNVNIDTSFTSNILFQVSDAVYPILFNIILVNLYIHITKSHYMISSQDNLI